MNEAGAGYGREMSASPHQEGQDHGTSEGVLRPCNSKGAAQLRSALHLSVMNRSAKNRGAKHNGNPQALSMGD